MDAQRGQMDLDFSSRRWCRFFGDHCSWLSNTFILDSTGVATDHMNHVKTQLPYALLMGGLSMLGYVALGA